MVTHAMEQLQFYNGVNRSISALCLMKLLFNKWVVCDGSCKVWV